ncbi:MAG: hypothetical protein ACFFDJ_06885 [Candidatus Odinarchaeota archaeon]
MDLRKSGTSYEKKTIKACPLRPPMLRLPPLKETQHWRKLLTPFNRMVFAWITALLAGLIFIGLAVFLHPVPIHYEIIDPNGTGSTEVNTIFSIVSSPIPFIFAIILGILIAIFIPLDEYQTVRKRLFAVIVFAFLFGIAYFIDYIKLSYTWIFYRISIGESLPSQIIPYFLTPANYLFMFLTMLSTIGIFSGLIVFLSSFFGEALWNLIFHAAWLGPPIRRRTAVFLQGGVMGTVISVDHKGVWIRGFTKEIKRHSYTTKSQRINKSKL